MSDEVNIKRYAKHKSTGSATCDFCHQPITQNMMVIEVDGRLYHEVQCVAAALSDATQARATAERERDAAVAQVAACVEAMKARSRSTDNRGMTYAFDVPLINLLKSLPARATALAAVIPTVKPLCDAIEELCDKGCATFKTTSDGKSTSMQVLDDRLWVEVLRNANLCKSKLDALDAAEKGAGG